MILALNTAQAFHELALLQQNGSALKLLKEQTWFEDRKDVDTLVARLQTFLDETGTTKEELTAVVVVKGPGSFMSLRTGVAFANALVEGLSASRTQRLPLYELTTFECLARKAALDPLLVILPAGGLDVGVHFKGEIKVGPLSPLLAELPHDSGLRVAAELSETLRDELKSIALEKGWALLEAHELQTLGEALQTLGLSGLTAVELVEPFYLRGPKITLSSDPWKQPRA